MPLPTEPAADAEKAELSPRQMFAYALPALPVAFLYLPLPLLIPSFYSQQLGLSLTAIGSFLFFARIFDFVIDPLLGRLSDRTRSRWGRRRPWMIAGAPIMMLGSALIFLPPDNVDGWYLMMATMTIYLGASMLGLAYSAWGAEVVQSYHGRARLAGFREVASLVGTLMAAGIPSITAIWGHGIDRFTMSFVGWGVLILTPPAIFAALRWVPEPKQPAVEGHAEPPLRDMMVQVLRNRPFRLLCIAFIVLTIGVSVTNSVLVFFITHYLKQPTLVGPVLGLSFLSVLLFVPVWVRISRRTGKHKAVAYSLLIGVVTSGVFTFMLQPGDGYWFLALMVVLGAASAAFLTLPIGIMGDVIDYDAMKNGEQRGGVFFGVWAFAQQIAPAIAIGVTLPFLEWLGFNPAGTNDASALQGLRYTYCFGPLPFYLIGALLLLRFPINARRHAIIRKRLDSRQRRLLAEFGPHVGGADPLPGTPIQEIAQ
ncbi:MFS transporter [Sphingosinicella microcystinivorans]|uniref:MFS transporter n=1 Tax=Sphingosinicella microcystinivorans TaxID=335406 RepID=UPI0022F3B9FF|nr:MFS transporter [Sphingosinicella microcystinivorans]WBX85168.1 MFS transporter [Sphingosinicella microcystinivorans]